MGKVKVVNRRNFKGSGFYVGRPGLLGNSFQIGKDGSRTEVVEKYRKWLWSRIKAGDEKIIKILEHIVHVARKRDVVLICWCAPLACHADVLKSYIEWRLKGGD